MGTKTCSKCGHEKPCADFYLDRGKPAARCKDCTKEKQRKYRADNIEAIAESQKRYRQENKDTIREKSSAWAANNPERMRTYRKKWRDGNKAKVQAQVNRWRKQNPATQRRYRLRRSAELYDNYVAHRLIEGTRLTVSDIPKQLIELKRQHLMLKRALERNKDEKR